MDNILEAATGAGWRPLSLCTVSCACGGAVRSRPQLSLPVPLESLFELSNTMQLGHNRSQCTGPGTASAQHAGRIASLSASTSTSRAFGGVPTQTLCVCSRCSVTYSIKQLPASSTAAVLNSLCWCCQECLGQKNNALGEKVGCGPCLCEGRRVA